MSAIASFSPLQGAIAQAESWTNYLHSCDLGRRRAEDILAGVDNIVWVGVHLGELLPLTWRLTFLDLFRPGAASWTAVKDLEASRHEVRRLFFTVRAAMESIRQAAETLQAGTGKKAAGMERLLQAIENARQLEEAVFRDWPSFTEPSPSFGVSLPVEESLAQALGISSEAAKQKMDMRRHELNSNPE